MLLNSWFRPALLAGIFLAGTLTTSCDGGASDAGDSATPPAAGRPADSPGDTVPGIEAPDERQDSAADGSAVAVTLDPEGLRLFLPSSAARPIPFGTPQQQTMAMVSRVRGSARETGASEDCGDEYATWENGLTLRFSRGRFAGWSAAPGSGLATAAGTGPGSTRADLEAAHVTRVFASTLGTEFSIGDIAGVLESEASDARVLHMWAGVACIGR